MTNEPDPDDDERLQQLVGHEPDPEAATDQGPGDGDDAPPPGDDDPASGPAPTG